METTAIHLVCTFVTFCSGGACADYSPLDINLRFQDGREFGEFWTSPELAMFPLPTFMTQPGEVGFDARTHIYVPAGLNTPYMISLSPDYTSAALTTHLPRLPESGDAQAASAEGPCRPAEEDT